MKYVYGPILSRRLGQSLGIDPIPLKTCNWNCVYCQLGRSVPLTNERKDYFPPEEILKEATAALEAYQPYQIDWISIVGSGEPLLCASIGRLIREIKGVTKIPIAVITSGSLLYWPEVRGEITAADAVLPTVNAGSSDLYRKITRPHPDITFEKYIEGLIKFREEYQGQLWPEVVLIKGLNDSEGALKDIAGVLQKIRPDEVHINLPVRPPAETWVEPSDEEGLRRAIAILGGKVQVIPPMNGHLVLSHKESQESLVDEIIGIASRHPLREEEAKGMLCHWSSQDWPSQEVNMMLAKIRASGKIQVVERYGKRFWCGVSAYYPEEIQGRRRAPEERRPV